MNLNILCHVHRNLSLNLIMSCFNPGCTFMPYFSNIRMTSLLNIMHSKSCMHFLVLYVCYIFCSFYLPLFNQCNSICCKIQILMFFSMYFLCPLVTSSLLGPNILFNSLFLKSL